MASEETAHDRFRSLAKGRVDRSLNDVRLIGDLSDRDNFGCQSEEVDMNFRALDLELKLVRSRFLGGSQLESEFRS